MHSTIVESVLGKGEHHQMTRPSLRRVVKPASNVDPWIILDLMLLECLDYQVVESPVVARLFCMFFLYEPSLRCVSCVLLSVRVGSLEGSTHDPNLNLAHLGLLGPTPVVTFTCSDQPLSSSSSSSWI